jgi:hypothetical protein
VANQFSVRPTFQREHCMIVLFPFIDETSEIFLHTYYVQLAEVSVPGPRSGCFRNWHHYIYI